MRNDKDNLIVEMTTDFALMIIELADKLEQNRKYTMAGQLSRAGISIGSNAREAQNAESKADFIHKFKIAAKEADETEYLLYLCKKSPYLTSPTDTMTSQLTSIIRIISKIISSSKR
jgi:four helix bundle protein